MKILFACERSAGHIFPALSLGAKMRGEATVYFFATSAFLKGYIEKEGFTCIGKSLTFRNLLIEGIWRLSEALYLILKLRPKKVIGFGGRDSFFLVLFSSLLGIETAIYEPNVKIGRANRLLAPFVGRILRGFQGDKSKKSRVIGIPLRKNIKKIDKAAARKILNFNDDPVVFCLGGSQGSTFLNNVFVEFAREFKDKLQIIHLTGKGKYLEILPLYKTMKVKSFVRDFYYEVEVLYSAADLVVSRVGANTLGEISFYRLPAVLLPHPKAGGHQRENALYLEKRGAAIVHLQDKFSPQGFKASLSKLIQDESLRRSIRNNLSKIRLGIGYEDFSSNTYF